MRPEIHPKPPVTCPFCSAPLPRAAAFRCPHCRCALAGVAARIKVNCRRCGAAIVQIAGKGLGCGDCKKRRPSMF
ncbi:MAG: hypothetical protein ACSHWZ_17390 [Sulfitobacter sp.]